MTGLIVRRLLQLPIIILVIYTLTLTLAWAVPGNPLENPEGRQPKQEIIDAMKRQYNLDSFWRFYGSYLYSFTGAKWAVEEYTGAADERESKMELLDAQLAYVAEAAITGGEDADRPRVVGHYQPRVCRRSFSSIAATSSPGIASPSPLEISTSAAGS